ncbi:MAG: ribonuclease R [candidate division Zixibacteria bacterium]|nr:ribonuclease R [candidate division Zixibacteria bacterium]
MDFEPQAILDFIRAESDHPMKVKELARALSIPNSQYLAFRKVVRQLLSSGQLVKLKRNRIGLASEMNIVVGKIQITRAGTGFLIMEGAGEDILIPQTELLTAFDSDQVMVRLTGHIGGRQAGSVIKIVERAARNIVGVFRKGKNLSFIVPDNPRIHRDIYIPPGADMEARDTEKVVAVLTAWDSPYLNPEGKVIERLGYPGDPGVDMLTVIRSFNLPEQFSPDLLEEADRAASVSFSEEHARRKDLTEECIYTIDPADAKDHDDAISVEATERGFRLGVHIADVSFFVTEGTSLDKEAIERGNSVYLPGMVIPMLPVVLSNDVCSLRVNQKRLAHSVTMDFDRKGKMLGWEIGDTVIKSRARLSYEQVQEFFDGDEKAVASRKVRQNLTVARELAQVLSKRRFSEGSLDFDLPESKIILNEKGEVLELGSHVRMESHRLVEEFMLAANRAVALEVFRNGQKMLYRVHGKPDKEKLENFSQLMSRLGYSFPVSDTVKPIQFARFLDRVKDAPEAEFINELLLRSMQKAVYQSENIGHFGLAFSHYTHFTSPIRRYPDLLVHRLLRRLKRGRYPASFAKRVGGIIDHVGQHCSETERVAEAAERQAIKVKQVSFMANHVGDEFEGVISGVTGFGFFVRLDRMGVEGMVRVSTIDDDYYHFDEKQYRLVGRRGGRVYRLGDKIRVGVLNVDKVKSEIDLFLPVDKKKGVRKSPPAGERSGPKTMAVSGATRRKTGTPTGRRRRR